MASHITTRIRYDGPALAGHEMDVQDLAPALIALANIVQGANRKFNGDAATMRVLVKADVEQKCFQIDISFVQNVIERAKALFESGPIVTVEDIAKFVGLTGTSAITLFKLIKWLSKKNEDASTKLEVKDVDGSSTVILIKGDGNSINVDRSVAALAADPAIMESAKQVVAPVAREGYDSLEFIHDSKTVETITKHEAQDVISSSPVLTPQANDSVSTIHGPVRIKSAQYEGNAKWSVMWAGRAIDVSMPGDWVRDFQSNNIAAPPGTILDVTMEVRVQLDDKGNAVGAPNYTVTEIHNVKLPPPPGQQIDLLDSLK